RSKDQWNGWNHSGRRAKHLLRHSGAIENSFRDLKEGRMRKTKDYGQGGFSLIEMMMVLAILMLVMSVTMRAIMDVQKRQRTEEAKVDLNQESREFVEQIVRDLHGAGFPAPNMYQANLSTSSNQVAAGLVAATTTSIWFEGDMDKNGVVEVVQYQL